MPFHHNQMCNLLIIEGRYILPVQLVVSVMGQQHLLEIVHLFDWHWEPLLQEQPAAWAYLQL
jgi:hypothetical protein